MANFKSLDWKNNLKEDILLGFAKGSVSANDFPHVSKKHFEEQLQAIKDDLWELFPNLKDKDPFPYNKKTKKYNSLIKIEDER
jgi:hypothetical protein